VVVLKRRSAATQRLVSSMIASLLISASIPLLLPLEQRLDPPSLLLRLGRIGGLPVRVGEPGEGGTQVRAYGPEADLEFTLPADWSSAVVRRSRDVLIDE